MKALVVGHGSIGQHHARLLSELGCDVAIVSRRPAEAGRVFTELAQALSDWNPAYVVVANRTSEHQVTLEALVLAGYRGRVLCEKPLFERGCALPLHQFAIAGVAYNLRYDPLLGTLKSLLDVATRLTTATIQVGAYLPEWRPGVDYRRSYSAIRAQGGGVLRDLSHELDYALWMFGPWLRLTASGGHLSGLEIDSDDAYTVILETVRCPLVSIHLNYLDRVGRRDIVVNADERTYEVDLVRRTIAIDGQVESMVGSRDDTYRAEHQAMLAGDRERMCTLDEALETVVTVEAAERAAGAHIWIER